MSQKTPYKRILLKLSGEALMGSAETHLDFNFLTYLAEEIYPLHTQGVQISIVIGAGNIFRGKKESQAQPLLDQTTGDHMGMLATIINSLAMQNMLEAKGMETRLMSAVAAHSVCEEYIQRRALRHLGKKRIVILAGGTGNPYFTTDTAASLRAAELGADLLLKATKVDGVYTDDPVHVKDAKLYTDLKYEDVLSQELAVMDTTAIVLCAENKIPVRVFNITAKGAMFDIVQGKAIGTLIH